jgi:hypothetical protein
MTMKKTILLMSLALVTQTYAQTEVTAYDTSKKQDEGVTYALPRNVLKVTVTAVKTTYVPGEYCLYANRYLQLKNISPDEKINWELTNVSTEEIAQPDSTKFYFIKMKKNTIAPMVQLTENGLLEAINTKQPEISPVPIVVQKPIAAITINPHDLFTEEIIQAGSSAKMAELIAQEIYKMRDNKKSLLSGDLDNMPKDGSSMQIMLNRLDAQDKALTTLFTGTTSKETKTYRFTIDPKLGSEQTHVLFRFSKKLGVVDADDLGGDPVYYKLVNLKTVTPRVLTDKEKKEDKHKNPGVIYNVPSKTRLTIFDDDQSYQTADYMIAQFGNTETLLNDLFNKKSTVKVLIDPLTGSLQKVDKEEENK